MRILIALLSAFIISIDMPVNNNLTDQDSSPLFSFGIISDVQYCNCDPAGTRFYRSSPEKLGEALTALKTDKPKFIIDLGDLIEKDFGSYKPLYRMFDSTVFKVYHVTGNHDYSVAPGLKRKIPQLQSNRAGYYAFEVDKFRFIVLNGNEISIYASTDRSDIQAATAMIAKLRETGEKNGQDWNGAIGKRQLEWLDMQLKTADGKNQKVFIMCHFPVWPENEHNLLNYREVLPILEKYNNIIAWFNGHNHAGNYGNYKMIHFVTIKGMVETETTGSYALVEVYKNKIWIRGSGREKSQILAY
jgi:manganese-dependent ADP-ribose/CDP-alcohol diphosphatase